MLEIKNVSVQLGKKQILDNVSLSLRPYRLTALVGRNGSGKSTLLNCVNRQVAYTGEIREGGKDLVRIPPKERAKSIAILPQTVPVPHITVRELVAFGRNPYLDFTGRLREADKQAVEDALENAGAPELGDRYGDTLSGGEKQRVLLAMILAQNTPILLLDEPTAHLDLGYEAAFLELLQKLKDEQKKTILVILHDLTQAVRYADDLIVLDAGKVIFTGSREECLEQEILEKTFHLRRYTVKDEDAERVFFSAE